MTGYLYTVTGGTLNNPVAGFVVAPSLWAGGPWSATSQHGGPVNALCASALGSFISTSGFVPNRLTVDLLKPVPVAALGVSARVVRQGRRMMLVDVEIRTATTDDLVAVARAVLKQPTAQPDDALGAFDADAPDNSITPRAELEPSPFIDADQQRVLPPGFHASVQLHMSDHPADRIAWLSSSVDHTFDGVEMSSFECCSAMTDLTTVMSSRLTTLGSDEAPPPMGFMNTDTTLQLLRQPRGRWFALTQPTIWLSSGVGVASVVVHDEAGVIGRSTQSVISVLP